MRLLRLGSLAIVLASAALAAQTPQQLPVNHPEVNAAGGRSDANALTERLRPSDSTETAGAVARKNFIDEFIFAKIEKDGIPHAPLASDEEFFRRVHIDLTGRIPRDDELRAFLDSKDAGKRDKLVDRLTSGRPYEAKWSYFFNDIYKPHSNRVGVQAKVNFTRWVHDNIHLDRPYNEMVYEMLTANAISNWHVGPASYVARWVITAVACEDEVHEDTSEELAIHAVKDFLGVDLTCISCHDGARHLEKINVYLAGRKREELWRMGAFFGKTNVLRRTEVSTANDEYSIDDNGPGFDPSSRTVIRVERRAKPGLLDPVYIFTGEKPDPNKHPRPEFARMLTSDPQFARATVNLLWSEMFGVGIVDPVTSFDMARLDTKNVPDGWTIQQSHPELLEALAQYFRENRHSLKSVIRLIAKSNVYQLSSQFSGEWKAAYAPYFARKFVRRLKAEEIHDSLITATNLQTEFPIRSTDTRVRFAMDAAPEDFSQFFSRGDNNAKELHFFLEAFGQTNREQSERSNDGEITQAILLMNSPFILRQIQASEGSYLAGLLKQQVPDDDKITNLFQRFLVRRPTTAEMAQARTVIKTGAKGWEDLQWLLMNKVEFVHNF